jgi:hypothetical protein
MGQLLDMRLHCGGVQGLTLHAHTFMVAQICETLRDVIAKVLRQQTWTSCLRNGMTRLFRRWAVHFIRCTEGTWWGAPL